MAHRILNMPIAVTNCDNGLQTCLFQSTVQCRHVCSCLFFRRSMSNLPNGRRHNHGLPTARAMAKRLHPVNTILPHCAMFSSCLKMQNCLSIQFNLSVKFFFLNVEITLYIVMYSVKCVVCRVYYVVCIVYRVLCNVQCIFSSVLCIRYSI